MVVPQEFDLRDLLAPFSNDGPAGEDLTSSEIYYEVDRLRQTDNPEQVAGVLKASEVRTANWSKVFTLCRDLIATKSKDLQLAAYLAESMAKKSGLAGIYDGLCLAAGFIDEFWPVFHPQVVGDDLEPRVTCLERLDSYLTQALRETLLTGEQNGVPRQF